MTEKKRIGRPPKDPSGGKRYGAMFRQSEALRARLMSAADSAGRSMSEEIERRLEASFDIPDLRLMIREEIRAALREERHERRFTDVDGSHKAPLGLWAD